jgi:alkanesulfonate monooxygenase SsuD/methylene tetrahydromethanopterin reductase-like flavin-dependent oxidoreductase (luciferase family)
VLLAKALATGDMRRGGRLTVGIGVGGRVEDYEAVGADPATQTMRGMAERVAVMKRVWVGEKITESVLPVGPAPVQAGGPPLLIGAIGSKSVRSAAAWADGLAGHTMDLDVAKQNELFEVARGLERGRQAQTPSGRRSGSRSGPSTRPGRKCTGICAATGTGYRPSTFEAVGTDEIQLIPTSSDFSQLRRVTDAFGEI